MKSNQKRSNIFLISFFVVLIVFVTTTGFNKNDRNFEVAKNLDIFYTLFRELSLFYVDSIDAEKLIKTGIDEMLSELDPYTTYIPEADMEDFNFQTTGQYGGIGSLIGARDSFVMISDPYEGKPAQLAGLQPGDIFLEIDGISAVNKNVSDISDMLKGTPATDVKVLVKRPYVEKPLEINIRRASITINPVAYSGMLTDDIGYISFSRFTEKGVKEVEKAVVKLKTQGAKALVLDLRSNPGGILDEAVDITNLFIDKGNTVVYTKGKVEQWDNTYKAKHNPLDTIIPMAVLVNSGSASASEIVAGALQDMDRALIVGTRTFGKGLVQRTRPLSFNSTLKVTTSKYYIPSGRCIQALDYSHRNEDGSVGRVPDSLMTEFKTRNGRIVKDGGGVLPDVVLDYKTPGKVTIGLIRNYMIFDYATKYFHEHPQAPNLETFEVNDEIYADFKEFTKSKSFTYETFSEKKLKELVEVAEEEGYDDVAGAELEALKEKLAHNIDKDLDLFKDEISELIGEEIIKRYYYQEGEIKLALSYDPWLKKTIEMLNDSVKYKELLAIKN